MTSNTHDDNPDLLAIGSIQMDIHTEPLSGKAVGGKHPAHITWRAGGAPVTIARTLRMEADYKTVVFGAQDPSLASLLAEDMIRYGATALIRPSRETGASVILPDANGGGRTYVQRAKLCRAHFDDEICRLIHAARLVIVGPIPVSGDDALSILRLIPQLSANCVLLPHPSLITCGHFGEIASLYSCVILNLQEAVLLLKRERRESFATNIRNFLSFALKRSNLDLELTALKLRHLTGGSTEFLITNGVGKGIMWAEGNWRRIIPHKLDECTNDLGAGDAFSGYYAEGRFLRGLESSLALERALAGVALQLARRNGVPIQEQQAPVHYKRLVKRTRSRRSNLSPDSRDFPIAAPASKVQPALQLVQ